MADQFLYHDLYHSRKKNIIHSTVSPLTCYICKNQLNGISITAKIIDGKSVFLCSQHLHPKPYQITFRK